MVPPTYGDDQDHLVGAAKSENHAATSIPPHRSARALRRDEKLDGRSIGKGHLNEVRRIFITTEQVGTIVELGRAFRLKRITNTDDTVASTSDPTSSGLPVELCPTTDN
jgi:hypothetical protein